MVDARQLQQQEVSNDSCLSPVSSRGLWKLCKDGRFDEAIQALDFLSQQGLCISTGILYYLLQGCTRNKNLAVGRKVHSLIVRSGYWSNAFLGSHLVRMFALCGSLVEADQVFGKLQNPTVFSWSAIISAHAKVGEGEQALKLYAQMQESSVNPGDYVFNAALQACSSIAALDQGKLIHSHVIESGFESDVFIGNTLINMYAKCGSLEDAYSVFNKLEKRNIVTWSSIITGCIRYGHCQEALQLFNLMQRGGMEPNIVTFASILKASSSIAALEQGRMIHALIFKSGCDMDLLVGNTLIDMYAKCRSLEDACNVFCNFSNRTVVTWSAMIAAYAQHECSQEALGLFREMLCAGMEPDNVTFVSILKVFSNTAILGQGKLFHGFIVEKGCELDDFVGNCLIGMYFKCSSLEDACKVFETLPKETVAAWNTIIAGYSQSGHCDEAIHYFQLMQQNGVEPDSITWASVLKACCSMSSLDKGKQIHAKIIAMGFQLNTFVGNTLIDMYAKGGNLDAARRLFDKLQKRDVVAWSAMIAGYVQHGNGHEALQFFKEMQSDGIEPDHVTFLAILKACASMSALNQGRVIHTDIIERGWDMDVLIGNTLLDMYAKCGSLEDAYIVFDNVSKKTVMTWNALIAGHAQHSDYKLALRSFENMQREGLKPNEVTFICLLSVCSQLSLVQEGCHHFMSMNKNHGIMPSSGHYVCLIELFGRGGCLLEATDLLLTFPFAPTLITWTSLLSHCRSYGNMKLGRHCFNSAATLDFESASGYMIMSSIYADAGMSEDADNVQRLRKHAKAWKKPGESFIEVKDEVHNFVVHEENDQKVHCICAKLKTLSRQTKREGYVPCLDLVLRAISIEKSRVPSAD